MFIAKIDIGDYNKGDEVPEDLALIWQGMYLDSPVEEVKSKSVKEEVEKVEEKKVEVKPKKEIKVIKKKSSKKLFGK